MTTKERVQHEGIVKSLSTQSLEVLIDNHSACSGCHAKGMCGMGDMKQKIISVHYSKNNIQVDDKVMIYASLNNAFFSVLVAYIIPSILILFAIFLFNKLGGSELIAAIFSLVLIASYFFIIYLFRNKIGRKITFTVEKIEDYTNIE